MDTQQFALFKTRLALAPAPRLVALGLTTGDRIVVIPEAQEPNLNHHIAEFTFGVSLAPFGVVCLYVYLDGTFTVAASSVVPTPEAVEYLMAYNRAFTLIREFSLMPRISVWDKGKR